MRRGFAFALTWLAAVSAAAEERAYFWRLVRGEAGERTLAEWDRRHPQLTPAVLAAEAGRDALRVSDVSKSPSLKQRRSPLVVVIRLERGAGDFFENTAWCARSESIVRETCGRFHAAGLDPAVVQLDLDCPTGRIGAYADWLPAVRKGMPSSARLSLTGMPDWLNSPELARLLAGVDEWTLQVHLTHLPGAAAGVTLPPLCDAAAGRDWARRAAAFGRPFRLALPTYGYGVRQDAAGRVVGLLAETDPRPAAREWQPDWPALAEWVTELKTHPPAGFTGIDWFRVPCDDDGRNLTPAAFEKLRAGLAPAPARWEVVIRRDGRLADVALRNAGDLAGELPRRLEATGPGPAPADYDLPGGRSVERGPGGFRWSPAPARVAPGRLVHLGWFRMDEPSRDFSVRVVSP